MIFLLLTNRKHLMTHSTIIKSEIFKRFGRAMVLQLLCAVAEVSPIKGA